LRDVRLMETGFSPAPPLAALAHACPDAGGIASYVGRVRSAGVLALELQHYAPLTLPGMEALADEAAARFGLQGVTLWHRVGRIRPAAPIVLAAAAARHRRESLEAVAFLMDHLKCAAWLWKRERRADGWHWIEPREEDHAALARWKV
jgi:molybdopterin synthase catalytic subunit